MNTGDPEAPMTTNLILRSFRPALAGAVALVWAGACGDEIQGPPVEHRDAPPTELLSSLIVSNPSASAATAAVAGLPLGGSASTEDVVYVSLPPGSVTNGETAVIRARGTEAEASAVMVDGGFDPIPVAAGAGDTLDIRIELAGGGTALAFFSVVPPKRPPVVVRTYPPPKKRDVPLNAVMEVVFSEPMDRSTLTHSSVQLLSNGRPVAGTLSFADGADLMATFTAAESLAPGTDHSLLITSEIEDLDGDPLAEPYTVTFTTGSVPVDPEVWTMLWTTSPQPHWVYYWSTRSPLFRARRLTVTRLSEPTAVVWEVVATTPWGFCEYRSGGTACSGGGAVAHGAVPYGAEEIVGAVEPVTPTEGSLWYRVSIELTDGGKGSVDFNTARPF